MEIADAALFSQGVGAQPLFFVIDFLSFLFLLSKKEIQEAGLLLEAVQVELTVPLRQLAIFGLVGIFLVQFL